MTQNNIHPTAIIEEGAVIGNHVTIEAFAVIKRHVKIGNHVTVKSHAYIDGYTTVGDHTIIFPGASIGCAPQALKYQGERSYIRIGEHCHIREYVTIHSSIGEESAVQIGDGCMIMAYCHIAHNCTLGTQVILSNNAALAGHVQIGDYAIIGGKTPIHQYVRIGQYAMVGGFSRVGQDIPPYTIGGDIPFRFGGLNLIGLKRHKFDLKTRQELSRAFRLTYRSKLKLKEALRRIEEELEPLPEIMEWLEFCRSSKRGLIGLGGIMTDQSEYDDRFLEDEIAEIEEIAQSETLS